MFENIKKMFTPTKNKKVSGVDKSYASVSPFGKTYAFYKGLTYDNAYPSISRIADSFSIIKPYAIDANGKPLEDIRVINKLYQPNWQMSSNEFRQALAVMSLVYEKVYVLVWSEENGKATPGGNITADNIAGFTILEGVSERTVGDEKRYAVGSYEFSENEVIELKAGVNPYNLRGGYSPSSAAQKWATIDDYIASYQAGLFENGAVPAGEFIITASDSGEFNAIVDRLEGANRGSGNNNNIIYTHRPIDPTSGKPAEAQLQWIPFAQNNQQLGLGEIFTQVNKKLDSVYGVPASIRGVNDNNTYASVRVDEQIFVKYTLLPFASRIWDQFTHNLNRITGGLGFAITFDLDIPAVAEEKKIEAEKKALELGLIEKALGLGFSLESTIDALELGNNYKLLKEDATQSPLKINNDKPNVDEGGEVETSPNGDKIKSCNHAHECNHCLKD